MNRLVVDVLRLIGMPRGFPWMVGMHWLRILGC